MVEMFWKVGFFYTYLNNIYYEWGKKPVTIILINVNDTDTFSNENNFAVIVIYVTIISQ